MLGHQLVERHFARVPERGVAEVMRKADRFGQVLVHAQRPGDAAADLRDLDRVGQAIAVVIAFVIDEDLRLVVEAAESGGVDDAVAVALEGGAIEVLFFRIRAAPARAAADGVGRKGGALADLDLFPAQEHRLPPCIRRDATCGVANGAPVVAARPAALPGH